MSSQGERSDWLYSLLDKNAKDVDCIHLDFSKAFVTLTMKTQPEPPYREIDS